MKVHFWYTALSFFYLALVALAIIWLDSLGRLGTYIPLTDFFLMALAIMRLVHLFTYDHITGFFRDWFKGHDPETFMGSCGTLINCPWCTGLWFALVVFFFYFLTPYAWYVILVLALSALASFFQILANFVGWSAEAKKRESQGIALPR